MSAQFNLKAVFSLIDKITAPLKAIDTMVKAASKSFTAADRSAGSASKSFDGVSKAARNTSLSFQYVEQAADRVTPAVTKMSERIGAAQRVLEKYGLSADRMRESRRGGMFGGILGMLGPLAGVFGAYELGKDFIHINATQDRFHAALQTTTGSAAGADKAMNWISMFERKAPYDYEQVADTYTQLQAYGLKPEQGALQAVADASGAHGKKLWQGSLAMVDAVNGMYRELKLFGIHAKEDKDQVELSWVDPKTGKWHAGVAQKGSDKVAELVIKAFESTSAGGMALYAKTWDGLMSNLTSAWWRFVTMIAKSGVWDGLKGQLGRLSEWLANPDHDAMLQKWADKIARAALKIFEAVRDLVTKIDWIKLISDIADLVTKFTDLIDKVGGFSTVIEGMIAGWIFFKTIGIGVTIAKIVTGIIEATAAAEGIIPMILAAGAAFLGLDVAMGPIALVILAVGALAAAAFLVVTHWDTVKKWFLGFLDFLSTSPWVPQPLQDLVNLSFELITHWKEVSKVFKDVGDAISGAYAKIPASLKAAWFNDYSDYMPKHTDINEDDLPRPWRAALDYYQKNMAPKPAAGPWTTAFGGAASAPTAVKGRVDIHVSHDGKPTVKSVQSDNPLWDFAVHNGYQGLVP